MINGNPNGYYASNNGKGFNGNESFKLVEKIQPKKSRTKYSKEQVGYFFSSLNLYFLIVSKFKIEILEATYWRNHYPDLITVEHLCKTLGISREKINVINFFFRFK